MQNSDDKNILLKTLNGNLCEKVPFWFMRQAGRYLPEYRETRKEAGGFLNMVYNPQTAAEITLQPIRRYMMNGAILFSDILVIPEAMGQDLKFVAGEGPKLAAIGKDYNLDDLTTNTNDLDQILSPIYETIRTVCQKLNDENFDQTAMIGFAGAPWTVATYMVEGGGSKNFDIVKKWAYNNPESFDRLLDKISDATIHYLKRQIAAGAQVVQIFDSWAGVLNEEYFDRYIIQPTRKIVEAIKSTYPDTLIIGFPKRAGVHLPKYAQETGIDGVGLDYTVSLLWADENLPKNLPVQGNLDPAYLLGESSIMEKAALNILETMKNRPLIFNLGHGVIKETNPDTVERLSNLIRNWKR